MTRRRPAVAEEEAEQAAGTGRFTPVPRTGCGTRPALVGGAGRLHRRSPIPDPVTAPAP